MDIFSHLFVVKICNVCLKRPKINEKEAGVGTFLKKILPNTHSKYFMEPESTESKENDSFYSS